VTSETERPAREVFVAAARHSPHSVTTSVGKTMKSITAVSAVAAVTLPLNVNSTCYARLRTNETVGDSDCAVYGRHM